ncbi:MAG: C45 family peptidase [Betaproteobacteria bacterium]
MFPIIDISGAARDRGRQYGIAARDRIQHSIATYARLFAWCGMAWGAAQMRALGYRDVIAATSADLLEEIGGIADGAGVTEAEILTLNARTEILPPTHPAPPADGWHEALARNRAAAVPDWGECTALAVLPASSRDGRTWLAQNWDWIGAQRAAMVLLRVTDEHGRRLLTLTEAGMLAKIGCNDRGFGVCLNILRSVDDGQEPGVPVHVLLRHLLSADDVATACATARALRHGASSNLLIADRGGHAASIEVSPRGATIIEPTGGTLAHTNHFLDPAQAVHAAALNPLASTEQRLECALAHAARAPLGRMEIQALLQDTSGGAFAVCRVPDPALDPEVRVESVAGVVMDLVETTLWVAPDVPARVAFAPVQL